jgi:glutamyl-tRNA reductase
MEQIAARITDEAIRASNLHKPMNSAHEAYAVILEEVDEFWEEVKKKSSERSREKMREELIQIGAMALRSLHDLKLCD